MVVEGGVAVLLRKEKCPHLEPFHCVADQESLCVKDVYKDDDFLGEVESMVRQLNYITYCNAFKHRIAVSKLAEELNLEFLRAEHIFDVRFLSLSKGCEQSFP